MNPLEQILINRARNGTYVKDDLAETAKKLWIAGDISEAVKDQALEIIAVRTDCEPPKTDVDRIAELEAKVAEQQEIIDKLIGVNENDQAAENPESSADPAIDGTDGPIPA